MNKSALILILISLTFLLISCHKGDDPVSSGAINLLDGEWEKLTTENSGSNRLPDQNVRRITVNGDGVATLQTDAISLTTFDGTNWNNQVYEYTRYSMGGVTNCFYDRDDKLWLSTGYAVYEFIDGDFSIIEETEHYAFRSHGYGYISNVFQDKDDNIWFIGRGLMYSFDGSEWIEHEDLDNDTTVAYPRYVFEDINGDVIANADDRFWKWNGGANWEVTDFRFTHDFTEAREFSLDLTGIPIFYIPNDGYYIYNDEQWELLLADRNEYRHENDNKYTIYRDQNGDRWINLQNELYLVRNGGCDVYHRRTFDNNELINEITQAPDGKLWLATTKGIHIFDGSSWVEIWANGLPDDRENCVTQDSEGNTWISNFYGTFKLQGGDWIEIREQLNYRVKDMAFDSQDNLWLLTSRNLFQYTNQGNWIEYFIWADDLYISANDEIFLSSQWGVYKLNDGAFELYIDHPASAVTEYNGRLLVAANFIMNTDLELFPFCNDQTNRSQPAVHMYHTNHFHNIFNDLYGNLWTASVNGISCFNGNNWVTYSGESKDLEIFTFNPHGEFRIEYIPTDLPFDGEFEDVFTYFEYEVDGVGNIWFSYEKDIFVFDGTEFHLLEPEVDILTPIVDIKAMKDGSIWFCTRFDGIAIYKP